MQNLNMNYENVQKKKLYLRT